MEQPPASANTDARRKRDWSSMMGSESSVSTRRSISPPPLRRPSQPEISPCTTTYVPSPVSLTTTPQLSASSNVDTVSLADILGDPLIKECWNFNFLHDVDYVMSHFDEDVRQLVIVKFIHGSWRREDTNRQRIDDAVKQWPNAEAIVAYMPEMFGCHHSKLMVLFRHDNTAEIIVHTSNMIPGDWLSMTNAVWRSPRLPKQRSWRATPAPESQGGHTGQGPRFKVDFMRYLSAYERKRTGPLTDHLALYDFGEIRGAFIASVPAKISQVSEKSASQTSWGWPGLQEILSHIPVTTISGNDDPVLVAQVSSVASLGTTSKWLDNFDGVLNTSRAASPRTCPKAKLIFPTPDEIRRSLGGYSSGSSIHMRTTKLANQKQLAYLRPRLHHWAGDDDAESRAESPDKVREAGRRRAAPHIKTYIRFSDANMSRIDWAMVTSANLSTQAWGTMAKDGEIRISSYETGVVVWPELYAEKERDAAEQAVRSSMIPLFQTNDPHKRLQSRMLPGWNIIVGFRMPYDLPLVPYTANEEPWCATKEYVEPDWQGILWKT